MTVTQAACDVAGSSAAVEAFHAAEGLNNADDLYDFYRDICAGEPGEPGANQSIADYMSFAWRNALVP